jgi:short-subunit dehydrogenase
MNKTVIITGASSGIGLATAKMLLNKGYTVFGISINDGEGNLPFQNYISDVNDYENVKKILKEIFDKTGSIDAFINNAGYGIAGAISATDPSAIYNLVNTNLSAVMSLSALVIDYLKKTKGRIINISSVGGIIPLPFQAVYSATKAGMEIFSRALANEVKPFGIKVTAVLPGDVNTNFTQNRIMQKDDSDENYAENVKKSIAKVEKDERTGKGPESVAKVIVKELEKRRPKLKVVVGFWYKCVPFLIRILPVRTINWIVRKLYC